MSFFKELAEFESTDFAFRKNVGIAVFVAAAAITFFADAIIADYAIAIRIVAVVVALIGLRIFYVNRQNLQLRAQANRAMQAAFRDALSGQRY